jgi:ribosomal protein S27E
MDNVADFTPVEKNCAVLFREGAVTRILATGADIELHEIACGVCENTTIVVVQGQDSPVCCPLCGNGIDDDGEGEGEEGEEAV